MQLADQHHVVLAGGPFSGRVVTLADTAQRLYMAYRAGHGIQPWQLLRTSMSPSDIDVVVARYHWHHVVWTDGTVRVEAYAMAFAELTHEEVNRAVLAHAIAQVLIHGGGTR